MPLLRRPTTVPTARRALALGALLASTAALSACAAQDPQSKTFSGAKADVQAVVQKLSDRADSGNTVGICRDLLTDQLRASLERSGSCPDVVGKAIADADYTALDVTDVRLNSDSAPTEAQAIVRTIERDGNRQITLARASTTAPWTILAFSDKVTPTSTAPAATTPAPTTAK